MRIRSAIAVLVSSAALVACNGWPQAAKLEEAEHKPEKYPTYAATAAEQVEVIEFQNRKWMVSPTVVELRGAKLESVGSAGQAALLVQAGTQTPYPLLYTPVGGTRYRKVEPID